MPDIILAGQPRSFEVQEANLAPILGPVPMKSWLDHKHPEWVDQESRWKVVDDFYEGAVADPGYAPKYLRQRAQGEAYEAFNERVMITDYTPLLGTLVDSIAGMFYALEDKASRVWTRPDNVGALGEPDQRDSEAARLIANANGRGRGWFTIWRQFALDLIKYQSMWVLIDTINGRHVVKLLPPSRVPDWLDGPTGPSQVRMIEDGDPRTSIEDIDPQHLKPAEQWVVWGFEGWQRWKKDANGMPVQLQEPGASGTYKYQDRAGNPALPIFRITLPLKRYVTWLLANKACIIYNQESVRDMSVRVANFSKLVLGANSQEQLVELEERIKAGINIIGESVEAKNQHRFIQPSDVPIKIATDILDKKIEHFFVSGFKQYADAAIEKTATEIRSDTNSGIAAFLQLLKSSVDDAENGAFYLLEQAIQKDKPDAWGVCRVERADDYTNLDMTAIIDRMRTRYLGGTAPVPVGRSALIQFAKDVAYQDGLPVDQAEIEVAVDMQLLAVAMDQFDAMGCMPAELKARLTMRLAAAVGIIDEEETIVDETGIKIPLYATLLKEATAIAQLQQDSAQAMAALPKPGGQLPFVRPNREAQAPSPGGAP